ncbi:hypothetical protein FHETE_7247 [Fusarium heterosporum]|uniref:2EXR domain-containing protein n=1 Tax=Fusarium heterosporum TaxID=42747 RepID=A0A8H5WMZ4_FUSHE|nr:hypothetical protein FHETE_7247 [Fusarium heterosporum]
MFDSFKHFGSLPAELQIKIWNSAVRPITRGIQIFSLRSLESRDSNDLDTVWADSYYLKVPNWTSDPKSRPLSTLDLTLFSLTENNPSTYMTNSGLWNACRQSRGVIRDAIAQNELTAIETTVGCDFQSIEVDRPDTCSPRQGTIIVCPMQDLFILQPEDDDMFRWSQRDNMNPKNTAPGFLRIRHICWEYQPKWTSSPHSSASIRGIDSLCCFIVHCVRSGVLDTFWLMNHHIKRKHWVASEEEASRPSPTTFETDAFELTEVVTDSSVVSPDELPWDDLHSLDGFLAFLDQLRQLVNHAIRSMPDREVVTRPLSINVLAYEDKT